MDCGLEAERLEDAEPRTGEEPGSVAGIGRAGIGSIGWLAEGTRGERTLRFLAGAVMDRLEAGRESDLPLPCGSLSRGCFAMALPGLQRLPPVCPELGVHVP